LTTEQTANRYVPHLDEMLTPDQCAAWLGVTRRWLIENADKVVPFRPGHKTTFYHPRTILAKLAFDAGVPLQIIAASYGVAEPAKNRK
jgi:hypothetical protein